MNPESPASAASQCDDDRFMKMRSGNVSLPPHIRHARAVKAEFAKQPANCCAAYVPNWQNLPRPEWTRPTRVHIPAGVIRSTDDLIRYVHDNNLHLGGIVSVTIEDWHPEERENWEADFPRLKVYRQSAFLDSDSSPEVPIIRIESTLRRNSRMTVAEFRQYVHNIVDDTNHTPNSQLDREDFDAVANHMKNLVLASNEDYQVLYGADNPGTLFQEGAEGAIVMSQVDPGIRRYLGEQPRIKGIHNPYVYFGGGFSFFGLHLEDNNLYSINYAHNGLEYWYAVPIRYAKLLMSVLRAHLPEGEEGCTNFFRHKNIFLPEPFLTAHGIPVVKIIQRPGDLVVTVPFGFHQGFNAQFNVNTATAVAHELGIKAMAFRADCQCPHLSPVKFPLPIREVRRKCPQLEQLMRNLDDGSESTHNLYDATDIVGLCLTPEHDLRVPARPFIASKLTGSHRKKHSLRRNIDNMSIMDPPILRELLSAILTINSSANCGYGIFTLSLFTHLKRKKLIPRLNSLSSAKLFSKWKFSVAPSLLKAATFLASDQDRFEDEYGVPLIAIQALQALINKSAGVKKTENLVEAAVLSLASYA